MPRSSPMVACQIDGLCWRLFGDPYGVGMRRRSVLVAAVDSVMVAAGHAAEVAVFGERLPFSAAEVAALVGGGDVRRRAADVFCGAADVRCHLSHPTGARRGEKDLRLGLGLDRLLTSMTDYGAGLVEAFNYYLSHQEELVRKYNGRFIAIKNRDVLGDFATELDAVREVSKLHELGTFLVQFVEPGQEAYTQTFHSRVAFA